MIVNGLDTGMSKIIILMGVSGAGKTTVGKLLAGDLGWPFYDADDYHPPRNIDKMRNGQPLSDEDRVEWLAVLRQLITDLGGRSQSAVIACSALKDSYRIQLAVGPGVEFVYLEADPEVTRQRLQSRKDHYMAPDLLQSQYDTLEVPSGVLTLRNTQTPETIVAQIIQNLELPGI